MAKPLKPIVVEAPKARSIEALTALFHCKGGPMRDKRERRAKEKKNSWRKEEC